MQSNQVVVFWRTLSLTTLLALLNVSCSVHPVDAAPPVADYPPGPVRAQPSVLVAGIRTLDTLVAVDVAVAGNDEENAKKLARAVAVRIRDDPSLYLSLRRRDGQPIRLESFKSEGNASRQGVTTDSFPSTYPAGPRRVVVPVWVNAEPQLRAGQEVVASFENKIREGLAGVDFGRDAVITVR